ncbi:MAG TPA: nucleoside triphosphate pyrophosphohydrolase [Armatimonadota bacterium]|nr:nucleoside triphosphate pyrophosphohydrolase [Armatimonadota bacterium]
MTSERIKDEFGALVEVVAALRSPNGCPWDREQDHKSLRKYLIEESYEVIDAIDHGSPAKIEEELGDVLLQVLLHAQIAAENGEYDIADVCERIRKKLIRRHPHVFGEVEVSGVDDVLHNWEEIKSREPGREQITSAIGGVPQSLPALMRAAEISKRAARTGFEWPNMEGVIDKLHEETGELGQAIESSDREKVKSEIGDLLFTIVNISRWAKVDPEEALREMLDRFQTRFSAIEEHAQSTGKSISDLSIEEMDEIWDQAKKSAAES